MFDTVIRAEVLQMVEEEDAQLVEVLPSPEYEEGHIAGAVNIPLKSLEDRLDELDRERPVIVYCNDFL